MKIGKKTAVTKELTRQEKNRRNNLKRIWISAAVAFILFICLIVIQSSILNQEEKVMAYQVINNIESGTKITESNIESYLKQKEVQVSLIPEGYITDKAELIDKFVNRTYKVNDIITNDGITDTERLYKDNIKNPVEIAFAADSLDIAVSGIIKEGDYINIYGLRKQYAGDYYSLDYDETKSLKTTDEHYSFMHVYVTKAFTNDGNKIGENPEQGDQQAVMFNVIIGEDDVNTFNEMLCNCTIRVSKLLYDTDTDYTAFITENNQNAAKFEGEGSPKPDTITKNNDAIYTLDTIEAKPIEDDLTVVDEDAETIDDEDVETIDDNAENDEVQSVDENTVTE